MANVNAAFGLRPVKLDDGSTYEGVGRPCYVSASDSTALAVGDPVTLEATNKMTGATIEQSSSYVGGATSQVAGAMPSVTRATAGDGNLIYGVVVGIGTTGTNALAGPIYRPASTEAVVFVETDPRVVYEAQVNGSITAADVGQNANLTSGTLSTATGLSGFTVHATITADQSNQLIVVGVTNDPDNSDLSAAYPNVLVKINQSQVTTVNVLGV